MIATRKAPAWSEGQKKKAYEAITILQKYPEFRQDLKLAWTVSGKSCPRSEFYAANLPGLRRRQVEKEEEKEFNRGSGVICDHIKKHGFTFKKPWPQAEKKPSLATVEPVKIDVVAERFKIFSPTDVFALPDPEYALNPIFPRAGVVAFYGSPGSAKTFCAMDLAISLAYGGQWFGLKTLRLDVTYLFLEGGYGAKNRLKALRSEKGEIPENFKFLFDSFDITAHSDLKALAEVLPKGGVVFVDTLSQASAGKDENHPRDMGEIVSGAKFLQAKTGGLVVLIHHSGKDAAKGMLGHTKLRATLDAAIEVGRDGTRRWWKTAKNKDGPDDIGFGFTLKTVEIGYDDYGEPVTSCVVVQDNSKSEITRAFTPRGNNQKIAVKIINAAMKSQPPMAVTYPEFIPHGCVALDLESILIDIGEGLACPSDKKNTRAREAVSGLVAHGYYQCKEGWLWKE
ncbi:MAG: AAA family ATPase [Porticoccaceae bacterium]